jgi:predicted enzyme related to lactoylglutathione lyase
MSDFNSQKNRLVWFDVPVVDLARATRFYAAVLGVPVEQDEFNGFKLSVIDHRDGNGGCLVVKPEEVSATQGILVYLNADHRIRDALAKAEANGGRVVEPIQGIGPHGFRAVILDSEGNRVALHSTDDQ